MARYIPLEISEDKLNELDDEHDGVMLFRGSEVAPWLVVLRRPTAEEAMAYKSMAADPVKSLSANTKLITSLSVYPKKDTEEWKRQYSRWPLFPDGIAGNKNFEEFCGIKGILTEREK